MANFRIQFFLLSACLITASPGFAGDSNGDGRDDILWRNGTTGQNWMYMMNGASITTSAGINTVASTNWKIVGDGDYNGDGRADILWRNSVTGQNWMYLMNGNSITSSAGVNTVASSEWQIVGDGDFDGDGQDDILWRNNVTGQNWLYLMNGNSIASSSGINTVADSTWKIAGNGDYNGDGRADILWRNSVTGQNWMYMMNGATITSSVGVNTVANIDWRVVGNGDYNNDGRADILWRNSVTGQNWLYLMNGNSITSSAGVNTVASPNWQVAGDGDYNGDSRADILWRNSVTGQNWLYLMDGASIVGSVGINTVADTNWKIVGGADEVVVDPGPGLDAHLKWRAPLPGPFSLVRPAVGPDGSVYAVDVSNNLVAVAPNGVLRWTAANAGSKGVDVGPDGTIYTGNEAWIKAYNPNGTLKWSYTQSPRAQVFHDVAVGPDGHVYALASSGLGVFSLDDTDSGPVLRWSNPEPYVRAYVIYTELAFGPASDGQAQQLYFNVNGHVRAIRLSDGQSIFSRAGLNQLTRPQVSPLDGTWHFGDAAYAADGTDVWTFDFGTAATGIEPAIGQSGTHYTISLGTGLYAISPSGGAQYMALLEEPVGMPNVDPNESMLLLPTSASTFYSSGLKAVRTSNGSPLWRMEFPLDTAGNRQNVDSSVAFSADGTTAYVMTTAPGGSSPNLTYVNAVDIDPTIPSASTLLRSVALDMSFRSRGQSIEYTGAVTVLDENRNAVSGATVDATWTLPDASTVDVTVTTNNSGEANISLSADSGTHDLIINNISKTGYTFDTGNSILEGRIFGF